MAISMYSVSVPIFTQYLGALSTLLEKTEAHCAKRKLDEDYFLTMRFFPNMFPFIRQVRSACDHAVNACGRVAGVDLPTFANDENSLADLRGRIARAIEFVNSIEASQLDGQEEKEIVFNLPSGERRFTGQTMMLNFSLPNFFFHCTTAYDLLRHSGVEIGKRDFMGVPVKV